MNEDTEATALQKARAEFIQAVIAAAPCGMMIGDITGEQVRGQRGYANIIPLLRDPFGAEIFEEQETPDSTVSGKFETSSPLRDEEDTDVMGAETDPGMMGTAEAWFRKFQTNGDDPVEERCPDDCPCMTPEEMPF